VTPETQLPPPTSSLFPRFRDRVALVTGGGSGIGRAACRRLTEEGAGVVLLDSDASAGHATQEGLEASGHHVEVVVGDVSLEADVARAVDTCVQNFGRLDILVASAGTDGPMRGITDISVAEWDRLMAVNVRGVFLSARAAIPQMRSQGEGTIVVVSSNYAFVSTPLTAAYCTSKGAVLSLARSLAVDLVSDNIRVNAVCPGNIDTPLYDHAIRQQTVNPDDAKAAVGRMGTPDEVASVIVFLASSDSAYMTGSAVVVDYGEVSRPGPVWGNPAW
jgi:NAD(P)-dependent dehydrogenase (short-subunit alcohol dehydrogenase family)